MHPDNTLKIPQKGFGYVYHLTVNGRNYIGISTIPWSQRWNHHKAPTSGCTKLVALLNYCRKNNLWDSIKVEFLQLARSDRLDKLLKQYIKKYGSYHSYTGLNSTLGGRDVGPFNRKKRTKIHSSKTHYPAPVKNWDYV